MNNICTTIQQSYELMALGLKPNTADMFYCQDGGHKETPRVGYDEKVAAFYAITPIEYIPAWSLSALLELMPASVEINEDKTAYFKMYNAHNKWVYEYSSELFDRGYIACQFDNKHHFEAAFETVKWLLQKKYIKYNNNN